MKTFKNVLVVIAVLMATLLVFISVFTALFLYPGFLKHYTPGIKFEEYKDDFNKLKDYLLAEYPDTEVIFDCWISSDGSLKVKALNMTNIDGYVSFPDDITDILIKLLTESQNNTENLGEWSLIRLQPGRIAFTDGEKGLYALVYSPDEKPTWMVKSEEKDNKVTKIGDGWYHIWGPY